MTAGRAEPTPPRTSAPLHRGVSSRDATWISDGRPGGGAATVGMPDADLRAGGAGVSVERGTVGPTAGRDFFISYTAVNRAWAEWIAVQLEAAGYTTLLPAFDFRPGRDSMHQM